MTTTPVGCYSPAGDSPHGCADMAGNVWEWTRSLWGPDLRAPQFRYRDDPQDGRENLEAAAEVLRVLRGGAFDALPRFARCAYRSWDYPHYGEPFIGFRVVVAPVRL